MSAIKVAIPNSKRHLKMFVKENYKLVPNKKLIKKMKENPNIKLPANYAFDKNFSKFVKIRNGKKYTTDFKNYTDKDKKELQYYGTTIYDRATNQVISSADIYKTKLKDGKRVKRKAYKNRIIKNNQAKILVVKKAKEVNISVTFYAKGIKKWKDKNGKETLKEFEVSKIINYNQFTSKTKQETIMARINADALKFWKDMFKSGVKLVWNGKRMSKTEFETKYPAPDAQFGVITQDDQQSFLEDLLKNGSIQLGELVDVSNITNEEVSNPIDESEFDLNSFMMTLDGEEPHDWDTKTNRCVYDFLIHRYGKQKGLIKQMKYLNLYNIFHETKYALIPIYTEEQYNKIMSDCEKNQSCIITSYGCFGNCWNNEEDEIDFEDIKNITFTSYDNYVKRFWGVSPKKIDNFCKKFNIPHYALDKNKNKILYSYPENKMKVPSLAYRCFNGHLYPIEDVSEIKSIARLFSYKKFNNKKLEKEIVVAKKTDIVYINGNLDRFKFISDMMIQENTQVIDKKVKMNGNNISSFTLKNTKYIFKDEYKEMAKEYCKLNDLEYTGQTITTFCSDAIKNYIKNTESNMNGELHKVLFSKNVKNRTHIGDYKDFNKKHLDLPLKCWDIAKCYSKCITEPTEKWIQFDFNAIPQKYYNEDIVGGLYYIETDDIKLFHKSNIYSSAIVKLGLKENIIEKSNIKFVIKASKQIKKDAFHPLYDHYKEVCKTHKHLNKEMNNFTTGMVGITEQKQSVFNASTEINDAYTYLRSHKGDCNYLKQFNYEDEKSIFVYGGTITKDKYINNLPMYIQILDESNMRLYQMIKKATDNDFSKLEYRKTDCCVVRSDIDLDIGDEWGDYRVEDEPHFRLNNSYDNRNVLINYEEFDKKYSTLDITDSADWKQIATALRVTGGLMINGRGGTGKTHVIKNITNMIGDDIVARIAFTNCAAIKMGGTTIHKFLKLTIEAKISSGRMKQIKDTIKLIIVDECSMVNSELWSLLYQVHKETKIPFLIIGDWRQIEPVEPNIKTFDYKYHPAVLELSKNTIVNLEVVYRYDDKLKELSDNVMQIKVGDLPNKISRRNLCYTNKTRQNVNKMVMDLVNKNEKNETRMIEKEVYTIREKETEEEFTERCEKNPTQDLNIAEGFPVISRKTIDGGKTAVNNEEFKILKIFDDRIILQSIRPDGEHKITIPFNDFVKQFLLAFCITIHKSQGQTFDTKITIHDWSHFRMSKRLKYTAVTRATKYENINIRD
tara:strand:- start:424 stop:4140 length:3717 start_codon:yes stop_codon:yes gene_type:complete